MPFLHRGLRVVLHFSSERIVTFSCLWLLQFRAAPCECGQNVKAVCQSRFRFLISKIIAAIQHSAFHTETIISYLILGFLLCVLWGLARPTSAQCFLPFPNTGKAQSLLGFVPTHLLWKKSTFQELPHQDLIGWNNCHVKTTSLLSSCPGEPWGEGSGSGGTVQLPPKERGEFRDRTLQVPSKKSFPTLMTPW